MRHALLILGAIAGIALAAVGVSMTVNAIDDFGDTRIAETRTPVPGLRTTELEEGKYVVFYEVDEDEVPEDGDLYVPPLEVRVRLPDAARSLELEDYSTDFNVSSGGRKAQAIATVEVPEGGAYTLAVSGAADTSTPAVVLGRPITGRIFRLILGLAGAAGGLGLATLMAALGIAFGLRKRRDPS